VIVKKKNSFNQPSNYYAIRFDNSNLSILAQGLGKEQFYNNLDNLRKSENSTDENKILATKILIFFKIAWTNRYLKPYKTV
jgi:hypothetical protein